MSKLGSTPASLDEKHSKYFNLFERIQLEKFIQDKLMMVSVPFDYYCVSIKQDIQRRMCAICSLYFSSISAMKKHKVLHSIRFENNQMLINDDTDEEQDQEMQDEQVNNNEPSTPIIYNIFEFLQSDFEEAKVNQDQSD